MKTCKLQKFIKFIQVQAGFLDAARVQKNGIIKNQSEGVKRTYSQFDLETHSLPNYHPFYQADVSTKFTKKSAEIKKYTLKVTHTVYQKNLIKRQSHRIR